MTKQINFSNVLLISVVMVNLFLVVGCANSRPLEIARALFGYVEPPKAESVMQSLQREYNLCMKVEPKPECVQLAYDKVRVTQGLDPKPIPRGYVVVVQEELDSSATESDDSETEK